MKKKLDANKILQRESTIELHRLKALLDQCSDLVVLTDTKDIIEFVNSAVTKLLGLTSHQLIGKLAKTITSKLTLTATKIKYALRSTER